MYECYVYGSDDKLTKNVPAVDFYLEWVDRKKGLLGVVTPKRILNVSNAEGLETSKLPAVRDKRMAAELSPEEVYSGSFSLRNNRIYEKCLSHLTKG